LYYINPLYINIKRIYCEKNFSFKNYYKHETIIFLYIVWLFITYKPRRKLIKWEISSDWLLSKIAEIMLSYNIYIYLPVYFIGPVKWTTFTIRKEKNLDKNFKTLMFIHNCCTLICMCFLIFFDVLLSGKLLIIFITWR